MESKLVNSQPFSYTMYEGEGWRPWPPILEVTPPALDQRARGGDAFVLICGQRVHSLRFNLNGEFFRWDCINGFNF